jgi:hypothetical protein
LVNIALDQIPSQNCLQIFNPVVKGLIRSRLNPTSKVDHAYIVSFSIKFDESFMKHQTPLLEFELRAFQLITSYNHKDRWATSIHQACRGEKLYALKILNVKLQIL